jgi:putative spermidine/putrescine transport system substrate-binding protein
MKPSADVTMSRRGAIRTLIAGGLAAPTFFVRNAWAEGKSITIGTYTGPQGDYVHRAVIPKFEADFGCRVFQTQGVTLGQIAIMRTQRANPTYSVMFMDDVGVPIARAEDLIVPLPPDKVPNLARSLPGYVLNDGYAAAFAVSAIAPCYNTQTAKPLASYADLWDPRYRGRVVVAGPKFTQAVMLLIAAAALVTGKPLDQAQFLTDQAWGKIAELKPNIQTAYDNSTTAILQLSQGQFDVDGPEFSKTVLPYRMRGAPVDMSYPKEGSFAGINCLTLVKNAPEPDLGAAFIDRMLDPAVQKGLAEATFAAPTIRDVTLNASTSALVAYPESRMAELKLTIMDWSTLNTKRGAIVEKLSQVLGA